MKQKEKAQRKQHDAAQTIKPEINLAYNKYYPIKFETGINYALVGIAVLTGLSFCSWQNLRTDISVFRSMIRGFILHLRETLLSSGVFHIIKISFRLRVRPHLFILAYFYISAG